MSSRALRRRSDGPLARDAAHADERTVDVWRLAGLLVPGLGRGEREKLASGLGITLAPTEPSDDMAQEAESAAIAAACRARLATLQPTTLQQLARLFAGSALPEARLFDEVFRERARRAFDGSGGTSAGTTSTTSAEEDHLAPFSGAPPALQPARTRKLLDGRATEAQFAAGGALATRLPGYEVRPGQMRMARAVAKALNDRLHLIVEAGTGTGKALDVDTPIATPDGWKRMGDLQVGDLVFDETGQPTPVVAAFDTMHGRPCYEVEFSDGSTLVADAKHEWVTYTARDRKWADRPRSQVYRAKRFATHATLRQIRASIGATQDTEVKSLRELAQLVGGHTWSLRLAAQGLTVAGQASRPRRFLARPLLAAVLDRLERDVRDGRRDAPPYTLATTEQIAATLTVGRTRRLNHAVPVAGPLRLPEAPLPIDPYFLGAWLGDGNSRCSQICSADPQVIAEIEQAGYSGRPLRSHPYLYAIDDENGKVRSRWQPGLTGRLRRLGLILNKHIPDEYLRISEPQRRALLAGLLDTDGTVNRGGAVEFTTTNQRLADGARELINSLGYRATVRQGRARIEGRDCGPKWTVAFTTNEPVFRLKRKRVAHRERTCNYSAERNRYRYVVAVRPVATRPVRCIQVEAESHLYLAGRTFIPTHNSIAYLLPAAEYAVANGRRVVVSTNTINLQEQLYFKDIPLLRSALATEFRAAVLKGRANYLCLRRWRSFVREGVSTDPDRLFAAKILLWLRQTETGDRSELALDDHEGARWAALLGADSLHCTPQTCRDNRIGRCFLSRARRRAESAHILVVNHSLLLADQALENKVLPEYDDLILDEAHHVEDAATMQLGVEIGHQELAFFLTNLSLQQGPGRYAGLVSRLQTVLITAGGPPMRSQAGELTQPAHDAVESARASLQEFFNALAAFARGALDAGDAFLAAERDIRLTPALRGSDLWAGVDAAWDAFGTDLGQADSTLARIAGVLEPFKGTAELVDDTLADLATARRQLAEYRLQLSGIVKRDDADAICWLSVRERGIALHSAPLDVGQLLDQQLFSQKDCVVLTSATLQVGGSFRYMRERLGLDTTTFTLAVPSPFDYRSQALLCVPFDLPDPSSRFFAEASHEALAAVCSATGGRTLVLFTSHAGLRAAHERLRRQLRRLLILGQGLDGPRQQLLERFRHTPNSVLLGTSSFWEGIDVVGDALSCLVIVKLPFSVPNDPVFAARSELFDDPFSEYAVPQAALRLKQGFGRLIRSARDRGVVAILDSRLWTKRYGAVFLRSLPPATQHRCSWQELGGLAQSWLQGGGITASATATRIAVR